MSTHEASDHVAAQSPAHRRIDDDLESGRYDTAVFTRVLVASLVVLAAARAVTQAGWI